MIEQVNKELVAFAPMRQKIEDSIKGLLGAKGLELEIEEVARDPEFFADSSQLEFVFMNLLSKMVNFCDQGKIQLWVSVTESGGAHLVQIFNRDQNIQQDDYHQLVNTFEKRGDKSKNIVEAHGGRLWLDIENGIEFGFTIPLG
ncbi:MAG: HAMP domain-containing histidine kinase [Magnetococcales bacterium]|nr:HAMP domain-containing histidine kinase [Magnetococcales bacterium]